MKNRILNLIRQEEQRQEETLMMIPSENYTYPEVRMAVGSVLMHKYAEGQPGKRYYQGNSVVDEVERDCEQMALEAFSLDSEKWGVNVQPHSGCPANLAVYNAVLNTGDKILAMYLPDGGHLSHGWQTKEKKITLVSKIYDVQFYRVDEGTCVFDYHKIAQQAQKIKPRLIVSGGTAYPRQIDHKKLAEIAQTVNAFYLADVSHEAGLIAGGANDSPFPYADFVTMTTHKTLRGPRGALIFSKKEYSDQVDESVFPGIQGGPHLHSIAGIAIALANANSDEFKKYAHQTVKNAKHLAGKLKDKGLDVVSGGTDKHLVLIDLRNRKINGWFAAWALEKAGIIMNRNTIPYDTAMSYYPSGLRMGTPAITVRGMKEDEMDLIAGWIEEVIRHLGVREIPEDKGKRSKITKDFKEEIESDKLLQAINCQVKDLCKKFPIEL